MRTTITILSILPFVAACGNGVDPDVDRWNEDHADSEHELARTESPCDDASESSVETDDDGNSWCGCGENEAGLYVLVDGENDFRSVSEFEGHTASDLTISNDGKLHIGGSDSNGEPTVVAIDLGAQVDLSIDGLAEVETSIELSAATDIGFEPTEIAVDNQGHIVASNGTEIAIYDGLTWTSDDAYSGEAEVMTEIIADGSQFAACGEDTDGNSAVFTGDIGATSSLEATVLAEGEGRFNAIHKSGNQGMIAVGSDASGETDAYWCDSSDCSDASAWSQLDITAAFEGTAQEGQTGEAHDVAFDSTGQVGVMVGTMANANDDGWAAVTTDGGASWEAVTGDFPDLTSCTIDDEGEFVVMGEGNFAVTGSAS